MFDGGIPNIISLPLAFVRSGNVALYDGEVYAVGNNLYSGSRTARSASDVYYLGVAPTEVYLSGYLDRWFGFPLRCCLRFYITLPHLILMFYNINHEH